MAESFIPLEDAAVYEGLTYFGIVSRVNRNPEQFQSIREPREDGGKPLVFVAVSSLTPKGRRAWKAAEKAKSKAAEEEQPEEKATAGAGPPWYVDAELNAFIDTHQQEYFEAVENAMQIGRFLDHSEGDRTVYAEQCAKELGIATRSLYRHAEKLLEAEAWAHHMEEADGHSRDHFRVLALCRKPKEVGTFPSLGEEQRALIENIWFDKQAAKNNYTIENAYEDFVCEGKKRGWAELPSCKTMRRYIRHIMSLPGAKGAHKLIATDKRMWENKYMPKCTRDTHSLQVFEYVVADGHTMDFWVKYTAPNGKVTAVKPVLVALLDVRSRAIMGDIFCINSTAQVVKASVIKMTYSELGGVPKYFHTDNGKDFTAGEMLGQDRKIRILMDSETAGFYRSMGVMDVHRSLPFRPWTKAQIERVFSTICNRFSKRMNSYTGTLTGSKTGAKVVKDIPGMLARDELLTMEEAYEAWHSWLMDWYMMRPHSGLKEAGEKWTRPLDLLMNGERYEKAVPPREFAAMLLMKAETATVTQQGIHRFNTLYTSEELGKYIGEKVGIKWDQDNVTKLYVYDHSGGKICEAHSAEALGFGDRVSQEALEKHIRWQKREYADQRSLGAAMQTPYEVRLGEEQDEKVVGRLQLTLGHEPQDKMVALPTDKEYRGEMSARRKKESDDGSEFFTEKAEEALAQLRAMN